MKKILAITAIALLFASPANATGVFIGADALHSTAKHEAENDDPAFGPEDRQVREDDRFGHGFNAGVRFDLALLMASVEGFYDYLDVNSRTFDDVTGSAGGGDEIIRIKDRYGAKLNLGIAILPHFIPFVTVGYSTLRYKNTLSGETKERSESEPLVGAGILIDLPLGITLKAAYDYQRFETPHPGTTDAKIRTHLGVARIGLIYNF
jgi:opacity protein-like surface antigen